MRPLFHPVSFRRLSLARVGGLFSVSLLTALSPISVVMAEPVPMLAAVPAQTSPTNLGLIASPEQAAEYARREQSAAPQMAEFKGGSVLIIGSTALAVLLAVVLLVVVL